MALNIFPPSHTYGNAGGVALYADSKLTQRASLFDLNGRPLQGNVLNVTGAFMPEFQAPNSVLYLRASGGDVVELFASGPRTAPIVTGAKGGNAALTSLVSALAQLGIVVDQTS